MFKTVSCIISDKMTDKGCVANGFRCGFNLYTDPNLMLDEVGKGKCWGCLVDNYDIVRSLESEDGERLVFDFQEW